jgi:16S rRNA (adenine(1408)-N(1))-methyltransferase
VTIDVGPGDGRAVLAAAARDARTLAIGLDPDAAAMAEASRRAARAPTKGGSPNAMFVAAAAEAVPPELERLARLVTVRFPWASLLRGVLGRDDAAARGVASLVAAGGMLEIMLAPAGRDRLDGLPTEPGAIMAAVADAFEPLGLRGVEARKASTDEIQASHSTWAKRLLGGSRRGSETPDRTVVVVRLRSVGP